ncbi:MAG: diguanylate cyclase with sensor [Clostridia bacterium]|nr:diguanylate cyclase with sensor [Clostridia bacterium]
MEAKCLSMDCCEELNKVKSEVDSYQKCVESSLMDLNNLNIKYEKTVREISSIFDLFQHINLITDYNNLYAIINDMLIGVLGVTSSTIFSFEESKLVVEASNISRKDLKNIEPIKDKIIAAGCLEGKLMVFGLSSIYEELCRDRDIKSAVSIPLMKKDQCIGVIFLEHTLDGYFKEENKQFLNTLAVAVRLAIENAQLYASLENMTFKDGMTGLYNHIYFDKEIQNCVEVYNKYGIPFTVSMIDIDNFMNINEAYGSICGDNTIKHIGRLIENDVRKGDIVCRCEGDKFAAIFRNTHNIAAITERLEGIRGKIAALPVYHEGQKIFVSCSFGIARSVDCDGGTDCGIVAELAEEALGIAKSQGKNRVVAYGK